jgi:hypothetical protein
MNPHCRIRSIRYKKSPHLIEVIPQPRWRGVSKKAKKSLDDILGFYPDDIAGIAMVAWGFDGHWSRATHIHKDSFIGQTLLPAFVSDVLRRDTMQDVIHDTIRIIE